MQRGVEGYTDKNKTKFNIIYDKISTLGASVEGDLKVADTVIATMPSSNISNEEELELKELLRGLEANTTLYGMELVNVDALIVKFETTTRKFLDKVPDTKGPMLIAKGSLIQLSTDQLKTLKDSFEIVKKIIVELMKRLKEISNRVSGNGVNYKKIKEFIENYVGTSVKPIKDEIKNGSSSHTIASTSKNVNELNTKCHHITSELYNLRQDVSDTLEKVVKQYSRLADDIEAMKSQLNGHATKINSLGSQLGEEIWGLKERTSAQFNNLEEYIGNNSVKRFYI